MSKKKKYPKARSTAAPGSGPGHFAGMDLTSVTSGAMVLLIVGVVLLVLGEVWPYIIGVVLGSGVTYRVLRSGA